MQYELHAIFYGVVQGVCFRSTVVDHARQLDVPGSVRNLSDGSVEVYAQGAKKTLNSFLENIQKAPGFARIEKQTHEFCEIKKTFNGFRVIY